MEDIASFSCGFKVIVKILRCDFISTQEPDCSDASSTNDSIVVPFPNWVQNRYSKKYCRSYINSWEKSPVTFQVNLSWILAYNYKSGHGLLHEQVGGFYTLS